MTGARALTGAVVVVGAAGGCGASLLAGALALLRAAAGEPALLVDLDLERGDLAGAWDVGARRTLADLAAVADEVDAAHVRQAAFPHSEGLELLAAPDAPAPVGWDPAAVARLVDAAAGAWALVVDAGAGVSPRAAAAAGRAAATLVVCPPTVPGARRARRALEGLAAAGADAGCGLVVGHGPAAAEMTARALARAAGAPLVGELPWSPHEARALGAGRWPSGRRRPLRRALEAVAEAAP